LPQSPDGFFGAAPATLFPLPVPVVAGGRTFCKRVFPFVAIKTGIESQP
jgi:hypothetical protein